VLTDHHATAVSVRGEVDEVVRDDEIAWVKEMVEAANTGVREHMLHAGSVQHAEDLT
jgi:hypothetical protein